MASDGIKRTRKAGGRKRQALLRASIEEGPNYLLAPLQRFHVLTLDAGGRRDWAETSWWVGSASNLSRTRRGGNIFGIPTRESLWLTAFPVRLMPASLNPIVGKRPPYDIAKNAGLPSTATWTGTTFPSKGGE